MRRYGDELDLSRAPSVLFFYGLSGAGKTHVGRLVCSLSGRYFYDADDDISDEMKQALAEQRPFTDAMRDEFFPRIVRNIRARLQQYGALVVTQGVYKQRHRDFLLSSLADIDLVCVGCDAITLQQRLALRDRGISSGSAAALLADFESPVAGMKILHNEGSDTAIVQQLNQWYAS